MKILASLSFVLLVVFTINGQTNGKLDFKEPQFKGGKAQLAKFMLTYLNYPIIERELGHEGGVSAILYISKEGKVTFVNPLGKNQEFKKEVKRVATLLPDWIPAKLNGVAIDTMSILRFYFSLQDQKFKNDSTIIELFSYSVDIGDTKHKVDDEEWNKRKERALLYEQGLAELKKENYQLSIDLFEKSKALGNQNIDLYYNLAVALIKSGNREAGCVNMREAALRGDNEAFKYFIKNCK